MGSQLPYRMLQKEKGILAPRSPSTASLRQSCSLGQLSFHSSFHPPSSFPNNHHNTQPFPTHPKKKFHVGGCHLEEGGVIIYGCHIWGVCVIIYVGAPSGEHPNNTIPQNSGGSLRLSVAGGPAKSSHPTVLCSSLISRGSPAGRLPPPRPDMCCQKARAKRTS